MKNKSHGRLSEKPSAWTEGKCRKKGAENPEQSATSKGFPPVTACGLNPPKPTFKGKLVWPGKTKCPYKDLPNRA